MPNRVSQDPRYHFEIWKGPSEAYTATNPSLSYVENHNADLDYGLAADDFKISADTLIEAQRRNPHFGNWTAPVCHMVRQTLELKLKWLTQVIGWKVDQTDGSIAFSHDLKTLWAKSEFWLIENGYSIDQDVRKVRLDKLVQNLHAIDPLGDLFRFGTSKMTAFGRNKTYDRVGYSQEEFFQEFDDSYAFLRHWSFTIYREMLAAQEGWEDDQSFDANDFPKA